MKYVKIRAILPREFDENTALVTVKKMPIVANFEPKNVTIEAVNDELRKYIVVNVYIT